MGRKLGDPADPLLVSVRSGAKFSMPGMMDTVLNLGLNDKSVKGLAAVDRRRALRLRLLPPLHLDVRPHRARRRRRPRSSTRSRRPRRRPASRPTPSSRPRRSSELCDDVQGGRQGGTPASRSRRTRSKQLRGAVEAVFRSWNGARAIAYRVRERISHDLGTAVNVQAMVFGNRDDNSRHRRRLHPQRGHRREQAVRRLPRQRPGRGRRGRHPQHRGPRRPRPSTSRRSTTSCSASSPASSGTTATCATPSSPSSRASSGCSRPASASAPAPPRCDGRRHDQGHRQGRRRGRSPSEEALQRVTADHLDQVLHPQFAGTGKVIAKGLAASPGAAVGKVYFTADDAAAAAEPRREGHPRAQRDQPRGRPRHDGRRGHPHRPRRPRQPRRRRRPRLGHARRRRRRGGQDRAASRSPSATSPSTRATSSRSTARPARSCSARWSWPPPSRRPSST